MVLYLTAYKEIFMDQGFGFWVFRETSLEKILKKSKNRTDTSN
jgi:hypothetical protein